MGNPGVNTALIPTPLKDAFNFGLPQNDARDFAQVISGNLIRYGVDQANVLPILATALIPDTLKFDTTKPDGYVNAPPNGRQLTDRTTDFLLNLFFNVAGFSDGTQAKSRSRHSRSSGRRCSRRLRSRTDNRSSVRVVGRRP